MVDSKTDLPNLNWVSSLCNYEIVKIDLAEVNLLYLVFLFNTSSITIYIKRSSYESSKFLSI